MRIHQISLWTDSIYNQRGFYGDLLNLPVVDASNERVVFQAGESQLVFTQAPSGWRGHYHFAFDIPENQYEGAYDWLSQRVELIENEEGQELNYSPSWDIHNMYFFDPAGNVGELVARHTLNNAMPGAFDAQKFQSISEIGITAHDVHETVQYIRSTVVGLPVFDGEDSDTFTAVGDHHGLLIVVKRRRIWYPETGKEADFFPFEVVLSTETDKEYKLHAPPYPLRIEPLG